MAERKKDTGPIESSMAGSSALNWRCIGPTRGGRVVAVAGDYSDPMTFYFGACAGGIWKTDDGGTYWECVSDGFLTSATIGALTVAPSDSNVIYAGTGETTIRVDVSFGDGVYRSTDAGRSWQHLGLADTKQIGEIRVHPDDPDLVYVAALGDAIGVRYYPPVAGRRLHRRGLWIGCCVCHLDANYSAEGAAAREGVWCEPRWVCECRAHRVRWRRCRCALPVRWASTRT